MTIERSSVEIERIQKRETMLSNGTAPYASKVVRTHTFRELRSLFGDLASDTLTDTEVTIVGRVMFKRGAGKIAFAALQEGDGERLQVMLMAQDLGRTLHNTYENYNRNISAEEISAEEIVLGKASIKNFDKVVDLGDFVEVTGMVATSIKGELSVRANSWRIVSKSIRPLPFLHAELSEEARVRQPYTHMIQSQTARDIIRTRSNILREVRRVFEDTDYIEVNTPVLQATHGGALARPFRTHVNALNEDFSLRIALELPLKKLLVAGVERVFELGSVFRNEGIDTSHSPEFMMLEAYEAYGDMYSMANTMQNIFRRVCFRVNGTHDLTLSDGTVIDFSNDFQWVSVYDALSEIFGFEISSSTTVETLRKLAEVNGFSGKEEWTAGKWIMELTSDLVEPTLIQPTFLFDWPTEAQPLARRNDEDPARILAWDLIVNGSEIGTAFTELVDPVLQREILVAQSLAAANGDPEAMELDEDFLRALEYGCPPAGGLGLGFDRLVMLFTNANIREVITFPLLKKEVF